MELASLKELLKQYFSWDVTELVPLGDGVNSYFNDTFKFVVEKQKYALQCVFVKSNVFADGSYKNLPEILRALNEEGHQQWYDYQSLELQRSIQGEYYVPATINGSDVVLRVFKWINNTPIAQVTKDIAFQAGSILADFHLSVHDVAGLSALVNDVNVIEPLPHFHDTAWYLSHWQEAVEKEQWVDSTINLSEHFSIISKGADLIQRFDTFRKQQLHNQPRVMHGDPKLANILFDNQQAVALIDFDTIMTGLWHYDVGDALRSLCNREGEDGDADKVAFDIGLFTAFMSGYAPALLVWTPIEREMLVSAIALLPLELGIRFLFGCHKQHFLTLEKIPIDAAKKSLIQLRLFQDIQQKQNEIAQILQEIMPKALVAHPQIMNTPAAAVEAVLRQTGTKLEVFYYLASAVPLTKCLASAPMIAEVANQAKGLWSHTCFELFISNKESATYLEFNGSPNGQSDMFEFQAERVNALGQATSETILPTCASQAKWQWVYQEQEYNAIGKMRLDLGSVQNIINALKPIEYSITTVLKDINCKECFLAFRHCRNVPDFHSRESLQ